MPTAVPVLDEEAVESSTDSISPKQTKKGAQVTVGMEKGIETTSEGVDADVKKPAAEKSKTQEAPPKGLQIPSLGKVPAIRALTMAPRTDSAVFEETTEEDDDDKKPAAKMSPTQDLSPNSPRRSTRLSKNPPKGLQIPSLGKVPAIPALAMSPSAKRRKRRKKVAEKKKSEPASRVLTMASLDSASGDHPNTNPFQADKTVEEIKVPAPPVVRELQQDGVSTDYRAFALKYVEMFRYAQINTIPRDAGSPSLHGNLDTTDYDEILFMKELHDNGPPDVCKDFPECTITNKPMPSCGFYYCNYADYLASTGNMMTKWLTLDHIDTYLGWTMRSVGMYNPNVFVMPFESKGVALYNQFEGYDLRGYTPVDVGMYMWRLAHFPSWFRFRNNAKIVKYTESNPRFTKALTCPWDYDIFKCRVLAMACGDGAHFVMMAALNPIVLFPGEKANGRECKLVNLDSMGYDKHMNDPADKKLCELLLLCDQYFESYP